MAQEMRRRWRRRARHLGRISVVHRQGTPHRHRNRDQAPATASTSSSGRARPTLPIPSSSPNTPKAIGADGLLVIPPFYFNEPPLDGLTGYYKQLIDALRPADEPLSYPRHQRGFDHARPAENLSGYHHLAGIKDSSGSVEGYGKFVDAFPELNMRCGTNNNLEVALKNGMGTILADGNQFSAKCANDLQGLSRRRRLEGRTGETARGAAHDARGGDWAPTPMR